jgi:hypothetical protein
VAASRRPLTPVGRPLKTSRAYFLTTPRKFLALWGYHYEAPNRAFAANKGDHGGRSQEKNVEVEDSYASRLKLAPRCTFT